MGQWWFYEVQNAQAAYDAVLELILNYSRDELTGLGAVSLEGKDECDHLYVCACSQDPPCPVDGVEEVLDEHGRRSAIAWAELVDTDGLQLHGCGDGLTLLGFLLWQYPGDIEPRWPKHGPHRERPSDGGIWSGLGNWAEWPP